MLERRAGEDNFKRLLQRLLAVSRNPASSQGKTGCPHALPKRIYASSLKAPASEKSDQHAALTKQEALLVIVFTNDVI